MSKDHKQRKRRHQAKRNINAEQRHRDKLKAKIREDEYKRQQADYMKAYRARQRQLKKDVGKNQNAINTLTNAMVAKKSKTRIIIVSKWKS